MKRILKADIERKQNLEYVKNERRILEITNCEFIVNLHYAFQNKGAIYYVSRAAALTPSRLIEVDFASGGELFYFLRKENQFSEEIARFYSAQVVLALEYLHSKDIIYRDLKPENIMLEQSGYILLTDFGLSKIVKKTKSFCGTPDYIPPEILNGEPYTKSVDWWQLGILLYELVMGVPPFYHKKMDVKIKKIRTQEVKKTFHMSENVFDLISKLLQKDPTRRLGHSRQDAEQIKSHPFFKGIDWEKLQKKEIEPPVEPIDKLQYFDSKSLVKAIRA